MGARYGATGMNKEVHLAERTTPNPDVMLGNPVIRATRIPVYIIVEMIESGETPDDLVEAYPDLTLEDIYAALDYDAETRTRAKIRAVYRE
jgi:uncharacterized protein (DUF433 family)